MRRGFLGGLLATIAGAGGQQERPFNAPAGVATPPGIQAGVSQPVVRARLVIVFGPTGTVNGIFEYQPGATPGAGTGPVLSGTLATQDPYGNPTQQGWVSYGGGGSYGRLNQGGLFFKAGSAQFSEAQVTILGIGGLSASSGTVSGADVPASITLQSKLNQGTADTIVLGAHSVQLVEAPGVTANIPVSSAGITTVAQVVSALISCGVFS